MNDGVDNALQRSGLDLVLVDGFSDDWQIQRLELKGDDRFVGIFRLLDNSGRLEVRVTPRDEPGPSFKRLDHCKVAYDGNFTGLTQARRLEIGALVLGLGQWIDAALATRPGATIAEALGKASDVRQIHFAAATVERIFGPMFAGGAPITGGWQLADVFAGSNARDKPAGEHDLILDFRNPARRKQTSFVLGPRRDDRHPYMRSTNLDLMHRSGADRDHSVESVGALLGLILQLWDHDDAELILDEIPEVDPLLLPVLDMAQIEDKRPDDALNLAIDTDCHQHCVFCSVLEVDPPHDGGQVMLATLCHDLAEARKRGVTHLRVNGYDPLTFSHIIEVIEYATSIGYDRVDIFSPFTRLADESFFDDLMHALPEQGRFNVPVYGVTAATHDAVVGRPGAFEMLRAALTRLIDRVGPKRVMLLSVATRVNVHELPELIQWGDELGTSCSIHMPYPSVESRGDAFFEACPRQTEVAASLARVYAEGSQGRPIVVEGVAPCVIFREMRASRLHPRAWLPTPDEPPPLPGTEYRDPRFHQSGEQDALTAATLPCPHLNRCALGPVCYQELLRVYVDKYGLDEFQPVGVNDLIAAASRSQQ